jgi:adenylate cyclase
VKRYLVRALLGVLLTLTLLGHIAGKFTIPFVDEVENLLYDTRVRLTAPGGKDERIVIVAIDERSLEQEGHWPWTRNKLAQMVTQLFDYGVAVVGFDMVFAERDESADSDLLRQMAAGPEDEAFRQRLAELEPRLNRDQLFAEALSSGPTVLGYYFDTNERTAFKTGELPMPAFDFHESMSDSIFLPRAHGYSSNLPVLVESAFSSGAGVRTVGALGVPRNLRISAA